MRSVKLWIAALLLRIDRRYFVGRAVTCVAYDSNGLSHHLPGRIVGGRVAWVSRSLPDLKTPELTLIWVPMGGDISDPIELSALDLQSVRGGWQFFDDTPVD